MKSDNIEVFKEEIQNKSEGAFKAIGDSRKIDTSIEKIKEAGFLIVKTSDGKYLVSSRSLGDNLKGFNIEMVNDSTIIATKGDKTFNYVKDAEGNWAIKTQSVISVVDMVDLDNFFASKEIPTVEELFEGSIYLNAAIKPINLTAIDAVLKYIYTKEGKKDALDFISNENFEDILPLVFNQLNKYYNFGIPAYYEDLLNNELEGNIEECVVTFKLI